MKQEKVLANYLGEVLSVYSDGETYDPDYYSFSLITKMLKMPIVKPRFRLFLLNPDETIDYEIPEEDIILDSGNYDENYQSGQRRSVTISLNNSDGKYTPCLNKIWVNNRFRLDIGIDSLFYVDRTYWFPRGIYILGNPTASRSNSDKQVELSLLDKFAYLEGKSGTLETTYEIPAGTDIEEAIIGILSLDNGSGYPIDLKPIVYDSRFKGMKMPYTLSKDAGSTLGEMILDIGTILNAEVYYNTEGSLCFISINETINDTDKPTLWDYTDAEPEYFNSTISCDFENVVNEIHVVGDSVTADLAYAIAENRNPESPICIQIVGRRVEYINDANIYSKERAQDRADYELRKKGILETSITLPVAFNPLLFVNNIITIEDSFFGYKREKFLIQSISYSLGTDSQMTLSCSNLTNFSKQPFATLQYVPCTSEEQARNLVKAYFGGNLTGLSIVNEYETDMVYAFGLADSVTTVIRAYAYVNKQTSNVYVTEKYIYYD